MKGSELLFKKSDFCGRCYEDIIECNCGGEFTVCEGYDIYHNEFNYSWECSECGRLVSISGTIVKAQKLNEDTDTWEDIGIDEAENYYTRNDQAVKYDDELKSVIYEVDAEEDTIRYIISDVVFEDSIDEDDIDV